MTSRRPHWDDTLVDAVIDLRYHCVDCIGDDYPDIDQCDFDAVNKAWAHEVIAAVEDWQSCQAMINISTSTYAMTVGRAEDAEAAIQRVRELHRVHRCRMSTQHTDCFITYGGECNYADKCAVCRTKYPCQTIRALGGRQEWQQDNPCWDGKHSSCVGGPCDCECHNIT